MEGWAGGGVKDEGDGDIGRRYTDEEEEEDEGRKWVDGERRGEKVDC